MPDAPATSAREISPWRRIIRGRLRRGGHVTRLAAGARAASECARARQAHVTRARPRDAAAAAAADVIVVMPVAAASSISHQ